MHINGAKSITIGIHAYNNSSNIIYLLRSILKQKGNSFSIDEVIVISDGSTDNIVEKVKKYSDKYPIVKLFISTKHRGSLVRLHQIFSLVKSKYICIFDGNVNLFKNDVLETMVCALSTTDTALVSANLQPISVKGLIPNMIKTWYKLQNQVRKELNNGDTIHNFREEAFGIRTSFAKKIVFPKAVTAESPYLFLTAKAHNLKFKFVSQALVLFRTPQSFKEFIKESQNMDSEKRKLVSIFGKDVYKEYHIPFKFQIRSLAFSILKNPLHIGIILLFRLIKFFPNKKEQLTKDPIWTVSPAAKHKAHSY